MKRFSRFTCVEKVREKHSSKLRKSISLKNKPTYEASPPKHNSNLPQIKFSNIANLKTRTSKSDSGSESYPKTPNDFVIQNLDPGRSNISKKNREKIASLNPRKSKLQLMSPSQTKENCPDCFKAIVQALVTSRMLVEVPRSGYHVKKGFLEQLLAQVVSPKSTQGFDCTLQLKTAVKEFKRKFQASQVEERSNKLSLQSKFCSLSFHNNLQSQAKSEIGKINELYARKGIISKEIKELQSQKCTLYEKCENLNIQIFSKNKERLVLEAELGSLKSSKDRSQSEVTRLKEQLSKLQVKSLDILGYVDSQQRNKILHMVSEEYKQVESDIYDYAAQLECMPKASSFTFQAQPFHANEKWLKRQMVDINKCLIQSECSFEEKERMMRDYVLKVMDHYKIKDEQMDKVLEFKIKCVRQFINHMRKWLGNWQVKQEYLKNLRTEFAKLSMDLQAVMQQFASCLLCDKGIFRVREITSKMEQNYKLGNSFY